jgi:hypothetical protein
MEVMLRRLLGSINPQMTLGEIQQAFGFKSREAVQQWLDVHQLKPVGKWRYRRVEVIQARDEDLTGRHENGTGDAIKLVLAPSQLETLCRLIAKEINYELRASWADEDYRATVHAWREIRDIWIERYLERYIDNRENAEHLWRTLDANADLLEQLAARLPG